MTDRKSDNISGFWTGVYDYPQAYREPVPFNAVITDSGGALTGESIEPNTFSTAQDKELFAHLSGTRDGSSVMFVKTYEKVPRGGHSIIYQGTLDASGTRIDGTWKASARWSGPFVMNRSSGAKVEQEEKAARELELVKTP